MDSRFPQGTSNRLKKVWKIYKKSMKQRSNIVIENELFFNIDFSSILALFWEVFGEVLGTQEVPRTPKRRFRATKSVEDAPLSDLLSTESIENRPKSGQRAPKSAKRVKKVLLKVGSGGMHGPVGRTPGGV